MRKRILIIGFIALNACSITMEASVPKSMLENEENVPVIVHGPHRAPRQTPIVWVEYDLESREVEIKFSKSLANVTVMVKKDDVSVMEYYLGDVFEGSDYLVQLDNEENTEGIVLYIVSNETILSVYSLD